MRTLELLVFRTCEEIDWSQIPSIPTVALIALKSVPEPAVMDLLVTQLVGSGCNFFMLGGSNAESLEDKVDYYLEDHELLGIPTTSHNNDSMDEMAAFIHGATGWSNEPSRCIMIVENETLPLETLLTELKILNGGIEN
jgi:hypothetical protein